MLTSQGRPLPFVFHVAGIDAAQIEFPPHPGNGTYIAWGTPAFYRQHRALDGFVQVALRFHHGSRDWPAVQRELGTHTHGKLVQASLLSTQSVNTERSIHPQAVALWLLAALFGVIGLLIVGQLLARLTFLEAAEYGTLRALGMSRAQLMTACLGRAAAIGAAGGLIAAVLGVALSPLLPVGLAGVAEPHPGIDADVPVLAVGLAPRSWSPRAARRGRGGGPRLNGRWPRGPGPASSAPHGHLPAGGRRAGPAGHGHPAGPAPRRGPDSGAGTQRDRQRGHGRGRAQRRDCVRRQPQPPARVARPVRRDLGRHSEQRFRD